MVGVEAEPGGRADLRWRRAVVGGGGSLGLEAGEEKRRPIWDSEEGDSEEGDSAERDSGSGVGRDDRVGLDFSHRLASVCGPDLSSPSAISDESRGFLSSA